jgi:nitrite reductase/ring-hydroxylating ferredoxin subunit
MPDGSANRERRWAVARMGELAPGDRKIVELGGRSIGIFNVDGRIIAVRNVCPHEGAPVCLGRVGGTTLPAPPGTLHWGREGEILACPLHGWEFDLLTGKALADRRRLRLYAVSVEDDTIFVTL